MNKQLSLFEMPEPSHSRFSLFLGAFPDHHTAHKIICLGNAVCKMRRLRGRMRPINHLHVSLPVPPLAMTTLETTVQTIGRVCKAVSAVTRPFEIQFDRVVRFGKGLGNRPLVLVGDDRENEGVRNLHRLLWAEFAKYVPRKLSTPRFVPHLTTLYDQQQFEPMPVEPVSWMVREIVLVLSEVGATKYHLLGRWEFGG